MKMIHQILRALLLEDSTTKISLKTITSGLEKRFFGRFNIFKQQYALEGRLLLVGGNHVPLDILDISEDGLRIKISGELVYTKEELSESKIFLSIDNYTVALAFLPIHSALRNEWGVKLHYDNFSDIEKYFKIISPVIIGQTLKEIPLKDLRKEEHKDLRVFTSGRGAILTIWNNEEFEFLFENICIRKNSHSNTINCYHLRDEDTHHNVHATALLDRKFEAEHAERQIRYFKWILLNLPMSFPSEIKRQLLRFILDDRSKDSF